MQLLGLELEGTALTTEGSDFTRGEHVWSLSLFNSTDEAVRGIGVFLHRGGGIYISQV